MAGRQQLEMAYSSCKLRHPYSTAISFCMIPSFPRTIPYFWGRFAGRRISVRDAELSYGKSGCGTTAVLCLSHCVLLRYPGSFWQDPTGRILVFEIPSQ